MPCPENPLSHLRREGKGVGHEEAEAPQPQERLSQFSEVGGWSQAWLLTPEMAASPLGLNGGQLLSRSSTSFAKGS